MVVQTESAGEPIVKSGPYLGNGVTAVLDYAFPIIVQTELEVRRQNASGTEDILALTTQYTVQDVGVETGGTITILNPAVDFPTGSKIVVLFDGAFDQDVRYSSQGGVDLALFEDSLDNAFMHLRQLKEGIDRAVRTDAFGTVDLATLTSNLNAVAAIDAAVATVAGIAPDVTTVVGIAPAVPTVAGIAPAVTTVAGIAPDVTAVVGIAPAVTTVAGIAPAVATVAGIAPNVTAVAGIAPNVTTVAGIAADVTTVAGIAADVTTVAASGISTDNITTVVLTGGTDIAYTLAPTKAITAYAVGQMFNIRLHVANGVGATLNVSGLGAVLLQNFSNAGAPIPLLANEWSQGQIITVFYDGTQFVVTPPSMNRNFLLAATDATPDLAADFVLTRDTSTGDVKKVLLSAIGGSAPPGSLTLYAANSPPTGYLEADGSAVSRTTFAALFNVIGTTFGVGDGTSTFNIPDMRGEFARGWDNSRGVDTARVFGSAQAQQLMAHTHGILVTTGVGSNFTRILSGQGQTGLTNNTQSAGVGSELRPRNIALMFAIKF